jgi:hypothetical protein
MAEPLVDTVEPNQVRRPGRQHDLTCTAYSSSSSSIPHLLRQWKRANCTTHVCCMLALFGMLHREAVC